MGASDLLEIANDICAAANSEFAKQKIPKNYKWILLEEYDDGKDTTLTEIEEIDTAILSTIHSLRNHPAYIKLKEYVENVESVRTTLSAEEFEGCYWTQPEQLITRIIKAAFLSSDRYFDPNKLLNESDRLVAIITSGLHEITLAGRLHGVKLEADLIEIAPNISLVRLDKDAINQRQPTLFNPNSTLIDYSNSNVEVRITEQYQIARGRNITWQDDLRSKLEHAVKAIKLYRHGRFYVYPTTYCSSLWGGMGLFSLIEPKITWDKIGLSEADTSDLQKAFSVVKSISQDNVLDRSFSRFLIGLDERVSEEQLVDFVIAWESLLQTVNGSSNKTELAYRFSLNGAAVLCALDNNREFTQAQIFMKKTYDMRSTIVHGGNADFINIDVRELGFDSLVALNTELAELYRKVMFSLSDMEIKERPYRKKFGWELLIRKPV